MEPEDITTIVRHQLSLDPEDEKAVNGCIYRDNWKGVCCPTKDKCYRCGWNPRIERQRKLKIKEALCNAKATR